MDTTMSNDDKLPDDVNDFPPAAFGAGAPVESYATYTKLRSGAFGIKVPGGARPGMFVDVRTRAGALRREQVERVLWSGDDRFTGKPMALCSVVGAFAPRSQPAPQPQPAAQPQRNARPATKAPSNPRRAKRQPLPRVWSEETDRELSDATNESIAQANAATTKRLDDERAAAEAALNLPEPEF